MKRLFLMLSLMLLFTVALTSTGFATMQKPDTAATEEELVFTEVGSAQDSIANNIVKDTVKKETKDTAVVKAHGS